mmetsp:Transcript_9685/g.13590  ORF Transcript_9685/g.13590 Transcript_9685/m.13590 type:complete len:382 (+) Transcript_9685:1787-2932(+)
MGHAPDCLVACRPGQEECGEQGRRNSFAQGQHEADGDCQDGGRDQSCVHGVRCCLGLRLCRHRLRLDRRGLWWWRHRHIVAAAAANDAAGHDITSLALVQCAVKVVQQRGCLSFVVDVLQEVRHVLGIHGAGLFRHPCWQIRISNDGDPIRGDDGLVQLGQLTVATAHSRQVHDYAARLHDSHGILGDEEGARAPRNGGSADGDVALLEDLLEGLLLHLLESVRGLLGVATLALTALLEVHLHPLCAHGVHLVRDVAHVPCSHHRSQSLGGADGRKPGHAAAEDESLGRRVFARRCHLGSVEALVRVCRFKHGPVPSHFGLGAKNVQLLGDGDARDRSDIHHCDAVLICFLDDLLALVLQTANPGDQHLAIHDRKVLHRCL